MWHIPDMGSPNVPAIGVYSARNCLSEYLSWYATRREPGNRARYVRLQLQDVLDWSWIHTYRSVVWLPFSIFTYIGFLIIPTDELIFFRGVAQPPTSVQLDGLPIYKRTVLGPVRFGHRFVGTNSPVISWRLKGLWRRIICLEVGGSVGEPGNTRIKQCKGMSCCKHGFTQVELVFIRGNSPAKIEELTIELQR